MRFMLFVVLCIATRFVSASPVFINELHYDNIGADSGEAFEIAGPAGTDLSGWKLIFYNGNNAHPYAEQVLTGVIANLSNGFGVLDFDFSGIQNGAPDGLALINDLGQVMQLLSYEGVIVGASGLAVGMVSQDIGVQESGATPVGASLELQGAGSDYWDFFWVASSINSFGSVNAAQNFSVVPVPPSVALLVTGFLLLALRDRRVSLLSSV